jgi:hypothetical protein
VAALDVLGEPEPVALGAPDSDGERVRGEGVGVAVGVTVGVHD